MRAAEKESRVNVRWRGISTFLSQSGPPPPPAKPCRDDAKLRRTGTDVAARPFFPSSRSRTPPRWPYLHPGPR